MNQLKLCTAIAIGAHKGQKRRGGEDYIKHPMRVLELCGFEGEIAPSIAIMHDVLEDSDETIKSLLNKGVDPCVIEGVDILTRKDGQSDYHYNKTIGEVGGCIRKIKIADMIDNLCDNPTDKQKYKYRTAFKEINSYL